MLLFHFVKLGLSNHISEVRKPLKHFFFYKNINQKSSKQINNRTEQLPQLNVRKSRFCYLSLHSHLPSSSSYLIVTSAIYEVPGIKRKHYFKHLSISIISLSQIIITTSLSQTSLYLKHPTISNISLSRTPLYFKHLSISNISPSRTPLYLKHLSISNIPLSQTSLYLKHPSISNIPLTRTSL